MAMFESVLFIIFFFFTHKQVYSASHFTGGSQKVAKLISFIAFFNLIFALVYLIYYAINISFIGALILLIISIIITMILTSVICRITISKMKKEGWDINGQYFLSSYNRKNDVISTFLAVIGIIVNIIIVTNLFFINIKI